MIRDLTPANLMITPEGVLKLVELEFMAVPAEPAQIIGTRGYAAPEQIGDDGPVGSLTGIAPAPRQTADLYSLGVLLFTLTCGIDPGLVADRPQKRSIPQRLAHLVRMTARYNPATRALAPAILGLIAADPDERWSLERVGEVLATAADDPEPALERA